MNVEQYLQDYPDYNYPDNIIEECLIRAEYAINMLSGGEAVESEARDYAIAVQTRFLLEHYGEGAGGCEEISPALIPILIGGVKPEVIYG